MDSILRSSTDQAFNAALEAHGPVRDDEIPALAEAADAWSVRKRRNAVRMLSLTDNPEAMVVLRERVEATNDVLEWAYAIRNLLEGPDGPEVARNRPEMVDRALESEVPLARGVALQAGVLAGRDEILEQVRTSLADPSWRVREAALEALTSVGPTPLEPELRGMLATEKDARVLPLVLRLLATSEDPQTAAAMRAGYEATEPNQTTAWLDAFRRSQAPWIHAMFLDLAHGEGPLRTDALKHVMRDVVEPTRDVLEICIGIYENTPDKADTPEWHRYQTWRQSCQGLVNDLAGSIVPPDQVLDTLRAHLAALDK